VAGPSGQGLRRDELALPSAVFVHPGAAHEPVVEHEVVEGVPGPTVRHRHIIVAPSPRLDAQVYPSARTGSGHQREFQSSVLSGPMGSVASMRGMRRGSSSTQVGSCRPVWCQCRSGTDFQVRAFTPPSE
jgi:hypothetical protein